MSDGVLPWVAFLAVVTALLAVDLGVSGRRQQPMSTRTALLWSGVWIALGLSFALALWSWQGPVAAQEYLAAYLIEKSLSVDNLFVFLIVFSSLGIALRDQRKVLFWGVIGAIVMRGAFIVAGAAALERFSWVMYVFGGLLVLTAVKILRSHKKPPQPDPTLVVRLVRRFAPVTTEYTGHAFTVRRDGRRLLTPLALALVAVESADLVFAIDSVPAALSVSADPFIVFTSNVAAILGLRSLYFALAGSLERFEHLSWGLALVLGFVGAKMLLADVVHVPVYVSLTVIVIAIGSAVAVSLWLTRRGNRDARECPPASERVVSCDLPEEA